jgi:hypothetical protein
MTVPSNDRHLQYDGNGVAKSFTGPKLTDADDLSVVLVDNASGDATDLVEVTDYVLSGVGLSSSAVELYTAPPTGSTLHLIRTVPYVQNTRFTNQGAFFPELHEDAFDAAAMRDQQLADRLDRTLSLPPYADLPPGLSLEMPLPVAGAYMRWNLDGDGLEGVPGVYELGSFLQSGTGAVARSAMAKLGDQVAVEDFGANGLGLDDTVAIQRAIDYVYSIGGGTVNFKAKTYGISARLNLYSGVKLRGAGSGQYPASAYVADPTYLAMPRTRILALAGFPALTPMLQAKPDDLADFAMHSLGLAGIMFDCAAIADYGLSLYSYKHSRFTDLLIHRAVVRGILEDCLYGPTAGTAQGGTATTILLATSASTRGSLYNNQTISITAGTGSGQSRTISSYAGPTQEATVSPAWSVTPDVTSVYSITSRGPTKTNGAVQFNTWEGVTVWSAGALHDCICWVMQGDPNYNVNMNTYTRIMLVHYNGDGLQIWNGDTNVFESLQTYAFGTGVGVRLKGNAKNNTETARNNVFKHCQLSGFGTGGLVSESGAATSAMYNCAPLYSTGNGAAKPVIQAGSNFWYNVDGAFNNGWQDFTPVATYAVPGDLSVVYATQVGRYWKQGPTIHIAVSITYTPTFTTASGDFILAGLPFLASNLSIGQPALAQSSTGMTWGASKTQLSARILNGTANVKLVGAGSGVANAYLTTAEMPSGTQKTLLISGTYEANQ